MLYVVVHESCYIDFNIIDLYGVMGVISYRSCRHFSSYPSKTISSPPDPRVIWRIKTCSHRRSTSLPAYPRYKCQRPP